MGITLKRSKLDEKSVAKDYGAAKRTPPKLRWFLIIGLVSIPLLYLMYMLLDETVFADFKGVIVFDTVNIRTPDDGYVEKLYVQEGEHIIKGQDLLQFKSPELDSQLKYLRQEQARIKGRLHSVARKSTGVLEENLAHLKKDIENSQKVYTKFLNYYKPKGHLEALKLEEARKNVVSAKQAYAQLQHQIKQIKLENDVRMEVNYKRRMEEIDHKIRQAELKQKYFLIKSPAKGSVKEIDVHRGEFLPGGEEIVQIVTKNNLHVVAFIDTNKAEGVGPKTKVRLKFPDRFVAKGEVMNVPSYADRTPLSFENPLATRENKLVIMIKIMQDLPEKYRVFGLPVEVKID